MKLLFIPLIAACFALCGCQPTAQSTSTEPTPEAPASAKLGTTDSPREIRIEAGDNMKFSLTRIEAAAGETLRLTLVNTGKAPKEAMGHNWVLLGPGVDATAFSNAAVRSAKTEYIPAELSSSVIAHTKMLGGGAKDAVVFTLPTDITPGIELPFICTFPAHFQLGMKGVVAIR